MRLLFARTAMVGIAGGLAIFALLERRRLLRTVGSFFAETAHPVNLAIFRMAVFWAIFHEVQIPVLVSFSRMPEGLKFAPWGMAALLPYLPIHPAGAALAGGLLLAFSVSGFVGLFSRVSALACALIGFYGLGIPNFYGKVDHYHHLLWFAAVLAASPCGDFLALDAIRARKRAGGGIVGPLAPARDYALPLRFVMLLTGVIYFFPGFWKLWQSGFDWFLTDNLSRQLHLFWTWSFRGLWLPAFRIDRHFLLCRMAASATVLFELSFPFLIFSPRYRVVPALAGLMFHAATNAFMQISFLSLCVCYVQFFNWERMSSEVGRVLSRGSLRFSARRKPEDFAIPASRADKGSLAPRHPPNSAARVTAVGSLLLLGAVWAGAARKINGWPFACYPTFSSPPPEEIPSLRVAVVSSDGSEREVRDFGLADHRFYGLSRNILAIADPVARDERLSLLWTRAMETAPELRTARAVRFYLDTLWIDPDLWKLNPRDRKSLFGLNPSAGAGVAGPSAKEVFAVAEWQ